MGTKAIDALEIEYTLSPHARFLKQHGMYSAALFYKNLNEPIERRAARVSRFHFENIEVPLYQEGQKVFATYPNHIAYGRKNDDLQNYGCQVNFIGQCCVDGERFGKLMEQVATEQERSIVNAVWQNASNMYHTPIPIRYVHGGLHNVVDFEFVLEYGLSGYYKKVEQQLTTVADEGEKQFLLGVKDVLEGMTDYLGRYGQSLTDRLAQMQVRDEALEQLAEAVNKVPIAAPTTFYEAFMAMQGVMFLSDCFETGRIDHLLYPYYEADLRKGTITPEGAYELIRAFFEDVEKRVGHPGAVHVTIGGTGEDGKGSYNALTEIVIQAIGGIRTPNVTLRVREDMPQNIWDACLENLGKGYGQPAIVNEKLFLEGLMEQYGVPFEDAINYVFGGCSEVLIQGKTACDSTWVAYNMLDVFEHTFYNQLLVSDTFEMFYEAFQKDIQTTLKELGEQVNLWQHMQGLHTPHPVMTVLTGDCIEKGKSFLNGGAKYNFDSTDLYGTTNAINALYTVKKFFEGEFGALTKEEFLQSFVANYEGYDQVYEKCQQVPKFGNHNEEINALTKDVMGVAFNQIKELSCYRGQGQFMPSIIGWVTWRTCGLKVGATPDGRKSGEPLADSAGPMQGTDTEGPTSTMGAALAMPQKDCVGTCILNLRLDPKNFESPVAKQKVQWLLETYFTEGGSQLQINVVDKEALEDAMIHPEKHRDIIVRVGGFSDNFVALEEVLRKEIIKRTAH